MPTDLLAPLSRTVDTVLGRAGKGTTTRAARSAVEQLAHIGMTAVGYHSPDEDIADWERKLWEDQDSMVEELSREWRQILHYCAGNQHLSYHRTRRRWVTPKLIPGRIRSTYNICTKAINLRVARLTENKPSVSVQAQTTDRGDIEKAEYKEKLWWSLWYKLDLHTKLTATRRWASKAGIGVLKVGWDADAGTETPATRKVPRYEEQPVIDEMGQPMLDPMTGAPQMQRVPVGVDEYYLDRAGEPLALVEEMIEDPDRPGDTMKRRNPVPEEADVYCEGEIDVQVRGPFSVRWDRYTDDIAESWYVQDAEIMPASKVLATFPDKIEELKRARVAGGDDKAIQWSGLTAKNEGTTDVLHVGTAVHEEEPLDPEYLVRETWIYPRNKLIKKLWGKDGALLITVGGVLVHKTSLPKWATRTPNFVALGDLPEEGNHYGRSFLRDVLPLQDDINRSRSHMAEGVAMRERLILGAPHNHQISLHNLAGISGVFLTYRQGHEPKPLDLGKGSGEAAEFYQSSLAAAADTSSANEASTGKLPSAGLPAKAIFALQYADERSVSEISNAQDIALKRLAQAIDAITREEYKEARKVRIVGADRAFLVEHELLPEHLDVDVDYHFVPGSMLARQKESIKNELMTLMEAGLLEPWEVRKYMPTAVPDALSKSYDIQEAHARRLLSRILRHGELEIQPGPADDPAVHASVLEEWMLSAQWEEAEEAERQAVLMLWQAYRQMQMPPAPVGPDGQPVPPQAAGAGAPIGAAADPALMQGAAQWGAQAEAAMAPPPGYEQGGPLMQ